MRLPEPNEPFPDLMPAPPPSTAEADAPRSNPTWRTWAAAAVVTVVVVGAGITAMNRGGEDNAAGVTTEQDDTGAGGGSDQGNFRGGGFGGGAAGEVTAIDDMTFTVESSDLTGATRTLTVLATSETTVSETVEGTLEDLSIGDTVVVMGEETDGGLEASSINEGGGIFGAGGRGGAPPDGFEPPAGGQLPEGFQPPGGGELPEGFQPPDGALGGPPQGGFPGGGLTAGEILEIDGSTITIESDDGETTTVTVTDSTTFTVSEARSLDDIAVGDTIRATGDLAAESEDGVVTATSIQLGDLSLGRFGGRPGAAGGTDDETS